MLDFIGNEGKHLFHRSVDALSAGAEGYLLKDDTDRELLFAIDTIRRGGVYLSPGISKEFTDEFFRMRKHGRNRAADSLTLRERQILKLIAEGKSNQEIADLLFISVRTVHHHRASLMTKVKAKNVADVVKYAMRQGYMSETS